MGKFRDMEIINEVLSAYNYDLIDYYMVGRDSFMVFKDSSGYKGRVRVSNLLYNKTGKFNFVCKSNPYVLENISLWLKLNNKSFELCDNNIYNSHRDKLKFHCFICNDDFNMKFNGILHGNNCSLCAGREVGKYNNLAYLRPDLAKEWIKSKNNKLSNEVTRGSRENVYWECSKCSYGWWATVDNRYTGRGCPKCADEQSESKIATFCKKYFEDNYNAIPEYRLFKNPETNYWLRCDIYIPIKNTFIEIHGPQHYQIYSWHQSLAMKNNTTSDEELKKSQGRDKIKKEYCEKNGVYIEVDLRKIKTNQKAVEYIENILRNI